MVGRVFPKNPTRPGATLGVTANTPVTGASADISADGRYVVFASDATNLVAGDTNGLIDVFIKDMQTGITTRVNTTAAGGQATGGTLSDTSDMSADGRYVLFGSDATNLVAGDTNGVWDLFLKDTQTGAITRVNTAADGTQVGSTMGSSNLYLGGFVSADGRYVVFESDADNLVAGDINGVMDIFKKDTVTGAITRVNTDAAGAAATGGAGYVDDYVNWSLTNEIADISADGRYVSFNSAATNLVAGDNNGLRDVFIKDTLTGAITRVNTDASGAEANALTQASWRNLSADGRYAVFHSAASNLVAGDTNGVWDTFVKDTLTGEIARVNLDAAGVQANGDSGRERFSEDGSMIIFRTSATNLVAGDTNGAQDVVMVANPFMLNPADGISLVSSDATGVIGNGASAAYGLSADGRFVLFESNAANLVTGDTNAMLDIFVKDTQTGAITRVSTDASGAQSSGFFFASDISADGRYVAMASDVDNMVAGDTDGLTNVFIKDTQNNAITQVDTDASGNSAVVGILGSDVTDMSADGRYVVIGSDAANLVLNDNNNTFDLFLKDTQTNAITRVNTAADGAEVAHTVGADNYLGGFVSDDGSYVVFESDANGLVAGDTNGVMDIFKKDIQTGAITQVNTDVNGVAATGGAGYVDDFATWTLTNEIADISADGRYVLFNSAADNLVAGDINGVRDVFIKDTLTDAIMRVSTDSDGFEANGGSQAPFHSLSADGRYAVFHSGASNLVAGDTNNLQDVFVKDIWTGAIARVNLDAAGGEAVGGGSNKERISDDGSTIVFRTGATNLVPGHIAGVQDVVVVANPFMSNPADDLALVSGNSATGLIANATSKSKSVSGDGHYVIFESNATNLVTGDTNAQADVFMKDTQTGAITRVSTATGGIQAMGGGHGADVSADGRYVMLVSAATDLVDGDTNGLDDVFIKDMQTDITTRVSTATGGVEASGGTFGSDARDISADGHYVVFGSDATNLVTGDNNGVWDVFLKDTISGTITRVNTDVNGVEADIGGEYLNGQVTEDGAYVIFNSNATNLLGAGNDTNGVTDIFKKNIATGAITRVSTAADGTQADSGGMVENFSTSDPQNFLGGISADGRYVLFYGSSTNLMGAGNDTNGVADVFLKDTQLDAITRVSTGMLGAEANGGSSVSGRALSADGRYVVFNSNASNLVEGDTNGRQDVFVRDMQTGAIARVNLDAAGGQAVGGGSGGARISADGSTISFNTNATNLVAGHVAGVQDVVVVANPFMTGAGAGGAGGNVVQLVDTTAPEINGVSIVGANSVEFEYSENVTVDLQATHGGIFLNGI